MTVDAKVKQFLEFVSGRGKKLKSSSVFFLLLAFYLILGIVSTWPTVLDPNHRVLGNGELGGWLWRYWLMKLEIAAILEEIPDEPLRAFLTIISLGRFPETGNVLDLLAISLPLEALFGHPGYYNVKVVFLMMSNALGAYLLCHYLTKDRAISAVSGAVFGFNSFVFYEVFSSGLRQATMVFIPLFVLALERTLRERRFMTAISAGIFLGLTAVFYWFNGLFVGLYALMRVAYHLYERRKNLGLVRLFLLFVTVMGVTAPIAGLFMVPYISAEYRDVGAAALPEVQWFADFPSLQELANVSTVPTNPEENLMASLSRVIPSSWSLDWAMNPLHQRALPLVLFLVIIAGEWKRKRKNIFWLGIFLIFYVLTLGPYLKLWDLPGQNNFVVVGDNYTVRMPYTWAFKFVPVMSRLFAPYRMGCMVLLALTVLVALNLKDLRSRWKFRSPLVLPALFLVAYFGQYFLDPMILKASGREGFGKDRGLPVFSSEIDIHPIYEKLASEPGNIGLIHLPLMLQQDLLTFYQTVHGKKVFLQTGWANPGALPPLLRYRREPKGELTPYLQYILRGDSVARNSFVEGLLALNTPPHSFPAYSVEDLSVIHQRGYRYILLHERGCFLVRPDAGNKLYRSIRKKLIRRFGEPVEELREFEAAEEYDNRAGHVSSGVQLGWVSVEPPLIPSKRPLVYRLSIFRVDKHVVELEVPEFSPGEAGMPAEPSYDVGIGGVPARLGGEPAVEDAERGEGLRLLKDNAEGPAEGIPKRARKEGEDAPAR